MQEFIHNDFAIGFPPRWMDASVVAIAGPPNEGYSPSITITRERLDFQLSAAEYAANQLASLKEELAEVDYVVIEEGPFSLTDLRAYQRLHRFSLGDSDTRVMQMQIYVVKDNEAITITCTNAADCFERTMPTFLEAMKQFKWGSTVV